MGSSVVIWPFSKADAQKSFLTGHTYLIGSIALSDSGRYLATGETDVVGTKVCIDLFSFDLVPPVYSSILELFKFP